MKFTRFFTVIFLLSNFVFSCKSDKPSDKAAENAVTLGVAADFDYLNPLLIQLSLSREVCTHIFPTLVRPQFDEKNGAVSFAPSLAKSWTFSDGGKTATFALRGDAKWEDGKPITSHDLKFSYTLYAEPQVASTRQHYINDLAKNADGAVDFENAVETPNDTTLILHFSTPLAENIVLDHFYDLMPVAKHVFESIPPEEIRSRAAELPIVAGGPYRVEKWSRQQSLTLVSNETCVLPHPGKIAKVSFLVIPEYTTRLTLLKTSKLDVLMSAGGINPKDVESLTRENPEITICSVKDRSFDSIVWLCIDGEAFRNGKKIKPNVFFGDKKVRQAMTYAIDRNSIVDGFMGEAHATVVNTPLSPAYKSILDSSLHPYNYNPKKARKLLTEAGWKPGADGILEKNGQDFSFTLVAPTGNARRNYAATVVQQNLKDIGIECKLEFAETIVFVQNQNEYRYAAAMSGLSAETLPFQLIIWGSNFEKSPFNSSAFQNARLDEVIAELGKPLGMEKQRELWHEYQQILHDEQPRTFLYYFDELEGFNRRVKNVNVNMLSVLYNLYDWEISR
ncbi:extracellular solute-binding protein family 5 [Chloroherpeton thalassium ATCC 35110]|uniref:Extracellular solute-binding protein family 5 n=1 Tax=Chloroherpeton thalassium (strain ATCC 35110 / GB-78) TaxID=517418 RepID=B3QYU3_CHLT3|nr:peptide-binding protein [Chloroherpeton thalassium]ACF15166.1 extracellular solute-binding protein family 5 [Chloroherpeton thalassium ATCC 35110]